MVLYIGSGGNQNIFLAKFDVGLTIYSNFTKKVIEGMSNVRWISDCFIITL